jgi:hypothetical protein
MSAPVQTLLDARRRCLLGFATASGPLLSPMAYWYDGEHLWMTTSSSALKTRRFIADGACGLLVPGAHDEAAAAVRGTVRVFRPGDPVGLLLHSAAITAAMGALAVSNASSIWGYVQDIATVPSRWAPHNRVVLRVTVDEAEVVAPPPDIPGVAPALPSVVPSAVRRTLSGQRRVTVAVDEPVLRVLPALWGARFGLTLPEGERLPMGSRVAVVVDSDPEGRPTGVHGLCLRGEVDASGALRADRATWWEGFRLATVDVPPPVASSGIVLPD